MSEPTPPFPSAPETERPQEVWIITPPRRRWWLYVLFFVLTMFSTLVVGARMQFHYLHNRPVFSLDEDLLWPFVTWIGHPSELLPGLPFSLTLMFILLAHEMGHYLYARHYRVHATLPFFVPFPSLIGTLGAFIRIKSPIPSRAALFDIGIAGPIAGFIPACVAMIVGLSLHVLPPRLPLRIFNSDFRDHFIWQLNCCTSLLPSKGSRSTPSLPQPGSACSPLP